MWWQMWVWWEMWRWHRSEWWATNYLGRTASAHRCKPMLVEEGENHCKPPDIWLWCIQCRQSHMQTADVVIKRKQWSGSQWSALGRQLVTTVDTILTWHASNILCTPYLLQRHFYNCISIFRLQMHQLQWSCPNGVHCLVHCPPL